jgi:MoaA/NifB/PqqE/SkfB family radical SAM enzyme
MGNILLTTHCNRSCSYCFAQNKIIYNRNNPAEGFTTMPIENFRKVLEFFNASKINVISILGGEPTLHPRFEEAIDMALSEGFNIKLFTNGIIRLKIIKYLKSLPDNRIRIIVNVNEPGSDKPSHWKNILNTFEEVGKKCALGININKASFLYDHLVNLILRYNLQHWIRVGLAEPVIGEHNEYLPLQKYRTVAQRIVEFSDLCSKYNIVLGFDCGFVMCIWTSRQIGKLIQNNVDFKIICKPIIDIGPNLDIWCCFPLSLSYNLHLYNFETYQQIEKEYERLFQPYRRFGCFPECYYCKYLLRGQCTGGCLGHIIPSFKNIVNETQPVHSFETQTYISNVKRQASV